MNQAPIYIPEKLVPVLLVLSGCGTTAVNPIKLLPNIFGIMQETLVTYLLSGVN